jgi:hypothetical protein
MSDIISGGVKSVYNTFVSLYEFSDFQTDGTWLARNVEEIAILDNDRRP